jgi:hypothetical protein
MKNAKPQAHLIMSAGSREQLIEGIKEFWCGADVKLLIKSGSENEYLVYQDDTLIENNRVVQKDKRWRFEYVYGN